MRTYFFESTTYSHGFKDGLNAFRNYIQKHSVALKSNKLNNLKGIDKLLSFFIQNSEIFEEEQEDIELILTKDGEIKWKKT